MSACGSLKTPSPKSVLDQPIRAILKCAAVLTFLVNV
jgi:hypothetical protein